MLVSGYWVLDSRFKGGKHSLKKIFSVVFATFLLVLHCTDEVYASAWKARFTKALKNGSAYVVDEKGRVLFDHRSYESFIPASTIKVATVAFALHSLGKNYRFHTEFYLINNNVLGVKGYGDPFLVSEELAVAAKKLKRLGLRQVTGIVLDTTYFDSDIASDGLSDSSNPYDALNGALIANFNTINIKKFKNGTVVSGEPQTPLTPLARKWAKKLRVGKRRVNLGKDPSVGAKYTGELIAEFLKKEGVKVAGDIKLSVMPQKARHIYSHVSSKTVEELSKQCLEFSTNFIANQLFLVMGARAFGGQATLTKARQALRAFMKDKVGWKTARISDGAGLSRKNEVSAREMMILLDYFEPYRYLLPLKDGLFRAKTGTLNGVNTYMGYMKAGPGKWVKFVILVNDAVHGGYKYQLAKMLYAGVVMK
jgi:D-alanyl-D-alanine carboxypeptidase/D-alanyl-D-alanine-endopeptidase (penicillin-binding protein 4)